MFTHKIASKPQTFSIAPFNFFPLTIKNWLISCIWYTPFLETPDENTGTFEGGGEAIEPTIDSLKDKASNSAALEEKVWGDSRATVKTELFMNGAPVTREILEEHENTPIKVYIKIEASSLKGGVIWESMY